VARQDNVGNARHLHSIDDVGDVLGGVRAATGHNPIDDVDRWGRSQDFVEQVAPVMDFLYDRWFRTEVEGMDNVPDGGALLVANHAGALPPDAPQIQWAVRRNVGRNVYMMGENLFSRLPMVGWAFRRAGGVEAAPHTAQMLLAEEGQLGLVFPEGTKGTGKHVSRRYQLQRFGRGGFVRVAMEAGVPIVPVAVLGAEEAMPVFANVRPLARLTGMPYAPVSPLVWLPVKFRIRFLEPLRVDDGPTDDHSVQLLSDSVRDAIQEALNEMLARRRWVFFG